MVDKYLCVFLSRNIAYNDYFLIHWRLISIISAEYKIYFWNKKIKWNEKWKVKSKEAMVFNIRKSQKNGMNGYNKSQYPYKTTKPRIVEGIDFLLESVKKKKKKRKACFKIRMQDIAIQEINVLNWFRVDFSTWFPPIYHVCHTRL